jgi:hypothetical protein
MSLRGFGIALTFSSGFGAEITKIDHDGIKRGDIDTSSMATTDSAMTFIGEALFDPGGLSVELLANPDTAPPITADPETITVTFRKPAGKTNAANWSFSGYLNEYKITGAKDGLVTATANIKASGKITFTASS